MSTKNYKYSFIEQSFTTSENLHYNLNLNQSKKCTILVPVQSYSKPNNDKYCGTVATDFIVSDDYEEKGKLQSWNKSSKASTIKTLNEDNNDLKKRWNNKNILNITSKSNLSLYIAAYKNSTVAVASNLLVNENTEGLKEEKLRSIKTSKHCFTDRLKNPFEFPRQQNENQRNEPEVAQFKASQRLLGSKRPTTFQQSRHNDEQTPPGAGAAGKSLLKMATSTTLEYYPFLKMLSKMGPQGAANIYKSVPSTLFTLNMLDEPHRDVINFLLTNNPIKVEELCAPEMKPKIRAIIEFLVVLRILHVQDGITTVSKLS
uniref:Uncharacterized protein n=1 Tax=Panagrolaimus davidi TaxID=227884 RepID=A0A914PAV6_9BILA